MIGVYFKGAQKEFPDEYWSAFGTLKRGEELLREDEVEEADDFYRLAWTKGKVLEKDLAELKARREEEARLKAEAERREAERLRALKEEEDRIARERKDAEVQARKTSEKSRQAKERQLPDSHTVKRGETLPQIAAQSDVYNDYRLWPLLYRANRDQIRDPKHIWPGQVLRIPRNLSREEISEARRYAQEKPIH
ncbi:MAG TPA: LysM peptidoglycan-binding domain-containing protein [Geobacteraceae bacterium]|nr:LysM peptidoglycan-binding domain-containing protein [Geobacteraceae bacterium]